MTKCQKLVVFYFHPLSKFVGCERTHKARMERVGTGIIELEIDRMFLTSLGERVEEIIHIHL